MARHNNLVNGWRVHEAYDVGFVVCDDHGVVEGPFRSKSEAVAAALKLPKRSLADWQLGWPPQEVPSSEALSLE